MLSLSFPQRSHTSAIDKSKVIWADRYLADLILVSFTYLHLYCWWLSPGSTVYTRDARFSSRVGQIGPKWDKSVLKKPRIIPFGDNLTHFGDKPTIPDPQCDRFGPTLVRLAPNGKKNPGLFKIRFQNI